MALTASVPCVTRKKSGNSSTENVYQPDNVHENMLLTVLKRGYDMFRFFTGGFIHLEPGKFWLHIYRRSKLLLTDWENVAFQILIDSCFSIEFPHFSLAMSPTSTWKSWMFQIYSRQFISWLSKQALSYRSPQSRAVFHNFRCQLFLSTSFIDFFHRIRHLS